MKSITPFALILIAVTALAACESTGDTRSEPAPRTGSSNAETACMERVNSNYGGKVRDLTVTSSEFSQAGTLVMLRADGERWKCIASEDGRVDDLSVVE